jgi:hypothetical protein
VEWSLDDVFEDGHVRPEIELLKDHGQLGANALDLAAIGGLVDAPAVFFQHHFLAGHPEAAAVGDFQEVDATQQGALAGTGRAEHRNHFTFVGDEVDSLQHLVVCRLSIALNQRYRLVQLLHRKSLSIIVIAP